MRRFTAWIREGITHPRPGIFLKALAVVAVFGALSHVSSIMGLLGGPWAAKPLQVRIADLLLLATNLVLAWGLWRRKFWAAIAWMAVVLLFQAVPILLFADAFAVGLRARIRLYSLLATDLVLLGILFALLPRKKTGTLQ